MKLQFKNRIFKKSNSDWKDGDWYLQFTINNGDCIEAVKETKLIKAARIKKGVDYKIKLGNNGYPIEVSWANGKVYIKNNNSIIKRYYD